MTKWRLCLLCLLVGWAVNACRAEGKYDALLQQVQHWTDEQLMSEAQNSRQRGDSERALVLYMVAAGKPHAEPTEQEVRLCAQAHLGAGDLYYEGGNYSNALNYYLKGLKLVDNTEAKPLRAVFYKNMGNVYCMFQDYEKGLSLYRQGLQVARQQRDDNTAYKILHNLTGVCIELDDVKGARQYYEEARHTPHEVTAVSQFMDGFTLALILRGEGQRAESINRFKQLAREAGRQGVGARYECSAYEEIAKTYHDLQQTDSTLLYLTRCKNLAEESGLLHEFVETLSTLSDLYEQRGDRATAFKLRARYWQVRDSVFNQRRFDAAKNQQFLYEMEKTEREIARLAEEQRQRAQVIHRQQWIIGCTAAGILAVLLVLLYVYRQNRRLTESYHSLYSLNRRLADNHQKAKEQEKALSEENEKLQQRLDTLSASDNQPQSQPQQPVAPEAAKYSSSNLGQAQRSRLAKLIAEVMEHAEHFCQPDFSLDTLAGLVASNSKYVSQVINEVYGKNFSNYVNDHRVELACARLLDLDNYGQFTIKGIGESVGFKSHSTFINVFKKNTGITPSMYQKLTKEAAKTPVNRE
ncbi:MAG: helix-turn-helix domain-containing protein [Alloprevotella sp.]